jgi:hypothetical protein
VTLAIRPLTPDLWPALEPLFGEKGACNGCWCMDWRIDSAYRKTPRGQRRAVFPKVVARERPAQALLVVAGGPRGTRVEHSLSAQSMAYEIAQSEL